MTQEEKKELLLQDLCARLPYGVKGIDREETITIRAYIQNRIIDDVGISHSIENVKPYLIPLLSMTEEQKEELLYKYIHNDIYFDDFTDYFLAGELWHDICVSMDILPELINWLNKNHFDYRGLIPMGLAIDATGLNIY